MWGAFYCKRDTKLVKDFLKSLTKTRNDLGYQMRAPTEFVLEDHSSGTWRSEINKRFTGAEGVQFAMFFASGRKKNCPMYHGIKKTMLERYGVPCQVILTSTLKKKREMERIANSVFTQINAKLGGVPWGLVDLPMVADKATMV